MYRKGWSNSIGVTTGALKEGLASAFKAKPRIDPGVAAAREKLMVRKNRDHVFVRPTFYANIDMGLMITYHFLPMK